LFFPWPTAKKKEDNDDANLAFTEKEKKKIADGKKKGGAEAQREVVPAATKKKPDDLPHLQKEGRKKTASRTRSTTKGRAVKKKGTTPILERKKTNPLYYAINVTERGLGKRRDTYPWTQMGNRGDFAEEEETDPVSFCMPRPD